MSTTEARVAAADELENGQMKEVTVGETTVLLARVDGTYHAVAAHCTHYGAPLAKGILVGDRIICPWHHACFNATTGDLEEPPALDALPCFSVRVEDDHVIVSLPEEPADRRTPPMTPRDPGDQRAFVIVGGGAAGYTAAQTLREDGFAGRVVMITRDDRLPYDRPNLSKDYLHGHAEPEWMPLRADEFYTEHGIEVMKVEVSSVETASKTVRLSDGSTLEYDALLLATGGKPRAITIPGNDLRNVFMLRSFADSDAIIEAAREGARAVVLGASFIGMEVASSLATRGCAVTVVAPDAVPFQKVLGPEIGGMFRQLHEEKGVKFELGATASRFEGGETVEAVVLENGERIDADLVVVGIGVEPVTDFLPPALLGPDKGVIVDDNLRAAEGLYAAGDIASFVDPRTGDRIRIEHWRTAEQQGRIAAHNMTGRNVPYESIPFFWTQQFDVSLRYVGHAKKWDEIIYRGDVSARKFLAFYVSEGKVLAVTGMKHDTQMAAVEALMHIDRMPDAAQLKSSDESMTDLLARHRAEGM